MTPPVSRGFRGRRREASDAGRVPPGQYVTRDFPVLSAGPTPHHPIDSWSFEIRGEVDEPRSWTWEQFTALPSERITVDIHCVTKWSKLDTSWRGVSLDTLLDGVDTSAEYVLAFSDGGYTSNLPLEDVSDGKAWIAYEYEDEPLDPRTAGRRGCSSPTSTSGRARSGCAASSCDRTTRPDSGRATATTTTGTRGKNSGTRATELAARAGRRGRD